MRWVTRERPKTDRIACPWLIRRFIDPDAEILYLRADDVLDVASREGARWFDAPRSRVHAPRRDVQLRGADPRLRAGDRSRARPPRPDRVRGGRLRGPRLRPLGAGLEAIGAGGVLAEPDDQALLQKGTFVYDALYAWCQANLMRTQREPHANAG